MLVLTRKKGETIIIGNNIEITVADIKGDQVRIGITAPKEVAIVRKELYEAVKDENTVAIVTHEIDLKNLSKIIKK